MNVAVYSECVSKWMSVCVGKWVSECVCVDKWVSV